MFYDMMILLKEYSCVGDHVLSEISYFNSLQRN
jgi:hypothetical protein